METPYGQDEEFLGQKYEFEGDMSGFEVVQCINELCSGERTWLNRGLFKDV